MKNTTLPLFFLVVCSMATSAQQSGQLHFRKSPPPQAMCNAAAPKLRESGTNEVVLTLKVDDGGKVRSFRTDSPKGLHLEKIEEAAVAIKALRFEPAEKDGRALAVVVTVEFHCPEPATDA